MLLVLLVTAVSNNEIPPPTMSSSSSRGPDLLRIKQLEEQTSALRKSVICAFNHLLDLKDLNTGVHSTRLAEWGMRVARELGLEEAELQNLEVAALLHDIGKVGIPDSVLQRSGSRNGRPALQKRTVGQIAVERIVPQNHVGRFATFVRDFQRDHDTAVSHDPGFERAALDILHHHESFNGKGYPAGLKNTEIPVVSRIVCVIDAFDAMVSSRPYRKGLPYQEAVRRLNEASGTQFDPTVVKSFLSFAESEMSRVFAAAGTSVSSAL